MEAKEVVDSILDTVGQVVVFCSNNSPDELLEGLAVEIDLVQTRFTLLSAIRDALTPDPPEASLELEEPGPSPLPVPHLSGERVNADLALEPQIVAFVRQRGPCKPSVIAEAIGSHHTNVGRCVRASDKLVKDGPLVALAEAS